jgi:hypothetical protein
MTILLSYMETNDFRGYLQNRNPSTDLREILRDLLRRQG